jgi:hypothetical protein
MKPSKAHSCPAAQPSLQQDPCLASTASTNPLPGFSDVADVQTRGATAHGTAISTEEAAAHGTAQLIDTAHELAH